MADKEDFRTFCEELKVKTQAVHDQSDRTINLKLVVVLTDPKTWAKAVSEFYFVFQTLEQCLENHVDHPHLGRLQNRALHRTDQFEKDLEFYLGDNWRSQIEISEHAQQYCDHLLKLSEEDPTSLIGYIHSMYLGVLSGGQIIKRIVRRTLGLDSTNPDQGLAIFTFENKVKVKSFIIDTINQLELTQEEKDAILREKMRCFRMNNAIANGIQPASVASYMRLAFLLLGVVVVMVAMVAVLYKFVSWDTVPVRE